MSSKYKANETAFLIESNRVIRKVKIVKFTGGLYTVQFGNGGGIKVRETRLFATEEEARSALPKPKPKPVHYPSPWEWRED